MKRLVKLWRDQGGTRRGRRIRDFNLRREGRNKKMEVERREESTEKEEAGSEVPAEEAETETDDDDDDFDLPSSTVPSRPSPSKLRTGATPFPRAASKGVMDVAQTLRDEVYESLIQEINSSSPTASKCGRPQASHADSTTVTLSWRPPAGAIGMDLLK